MLVTTEQLSMKFLEVDNVRHLIGIICILWDSFGSLIKSLTWQRFVSFSVLHIMAKYVILVVPHEVGCSSNELYYCGRCNGGSINVS